MSYSTINIEEIKTFNEELKRRKEQANTLAATVEVYKRELRERCAELSRDLGCEVNEDNLEEIYNSYAAQLAQTLETGKAVLEKIKNDEQSMIVHGTSSQAQQIQTAQQAHEVQSVQQVPMNQQTYTNVGQMPMYGGIAGQPVYNPNGGGFTGQQQVFDQNSSFGVNNGSVII